MTETNITDYYSALHLSINNYRGIYGKLLGENYWDIYGYLSNSKPNEA
jgi:hypothetical protein